MIPRLALTIGEPAGIGPDICAAIAQRPHPAELVLIGDERVLRDRAEALALPLQLESFDPTAAPTPQRAGQIKLLQTRVPTAPVEAGRLNPKNAAFVLEMLARACDGCVTGRFDAMVTAPVHKGVINDAGFRFSGHTEFLAERTGGHPVMLLSTSGLRVALATTHLPLRAVADAIEPAQLQSVLETLHAALRRDFGLREPRILVCGLNPHAGEGGHLGLEERTIIEPVIAALKSRGLVLHGPIPADTAFVPEQLAHCDAVLAMYHDQGLPVLKHAGFGRAVNITLGLPIVRTSVDHGTALALAARGQADAGSLEAAITTAIEMVRNRQRIRAG